MDWMEVIRTRRSVRTFDGRRPSADDLGKLKEMIGGTNDPFGIKTEFVFLDTEEYGLSTPVIRGEKMYMTAKIPKMPHGEEAYGYAFEKAVLYAWSLGLGTTWIGGTMKREDFEKASGTGKDECMYCISPLGYPAKKMSFREAAMRKGVRADSRKPAEQLFFEGNWDTPLKTDDPAVKDALEAVRLAPSAVNKQPWRILKVNDSYHFYVRHDRGFGGSGTGDMQKIDLGIALCHFMMFVKGTLRISDPGIPAAENTEYIATVTLQR